MIARIEPSKLSGIITAPPSKSMAHRHLICAAMADGISHIHGISDSDDITATITSLSALGCEISVTNGIATVIGKRPAEFNDMAKLFVNESGSTLRFMIPLCLLGGGTYNLSGKPRLFERPLSVYETICREQNLGWLVGDHNLTVSGILRAGEFYVPGNISSQFISGLLFALPCLTGDSTIHITETAASLSYILMTLEVLAEHGITVHFDGKTTLHIPGGQAYRTGEYMVESDYSNAAFFDALAVLGHDVSVSGMKPDSLQGDKIYCEYFAKLAEGAPVLPIGNCPDLAPILMAIAAEKNGCTLTETARLKIKESDRGTVMAEELSKLGAEITVLDDTIHVKKSKLHTPTSPLEAHGDHRVVMSLSVLATKYGGEILHAEHVNKSFPTFFHELSALGAKVTLHDTEQK